MRKTSGIITANFARQTVENVDAKIKAEWKEIAYETILKLANRKQRKAVFKFKDRLVSEAETILFVDEFAAELRAYHYSVTANDTRMVVSW